MSLRQTLLALMLCAACGNDDKKHTSAAPASCEQYAKMEISCGKAKPGAQPTILSYCEKARDPGKDVTLQLISLETSCAQVTSDCDAYKQCVEQKKRDTTPNL